jgi:hypothetical protein
MSIAASVASTTTAVEALTAIRPLVNFKKRYGWIATAIQDCAQGRAVEASDALRFLAQRIEHGATMAQCERPHRRSGKTDRKRAAGAETRRRSNQAARAEKSRAMKGRK